MKSSFAALLRCLARSMENNAHTIKMASSGNMTIADMSRSVRANIEITADIFSIVAGIAPDKALKDLIDAVKRSEMDLKAIQRLMTTEEQDPQIRKRDKPKVLNDLRVIRRRLDEIRTDAIRVPKTGYPENVQKILIALPTRLKERAKEVEDFYRKVQGW